MTRTRAFAVVCLLLVLAGGSFPPALGEAERSGAPTSEQIAIPGGITDSLDVQIHPRDDTILRDQSTSFVVRVENAQNSGWVFICVDAHDDAPVHVEFQTNDVFPFTPPFATDLFCPESAGGGFIRGEDVDEVESIPVSVSRDGGRFPIGKQDFTVLTTFEKPGLTLTEPFSLRVACPIDCRLLLLWRFIVQNIDLIIGLLTLLIALLGRKRILGALGLLSGRDTGTVGGEPPDAETGSGEPRPDE